MLTQLYQSFIMNKDKFVILLTGCINSNGMKYTALIPIIFLLLIIFLNIRKAEDLNL